MIDLKDAYMLVKEENKCDVYEQYFYTDDYYLFTIDKGGEWMSGVSTVFVDRQNGKMYKNVEDLLKEKNISKQEFAKSLKKDCKEGIVEL